MNSEFSSSRLTMGQINAIVKKLGGYDGALRFLRGETSVGETKSKWREEGGIIYFSVMSDGTTGAEWIERLKKKGIEVTDCAQSVLCSKEFSPTSGVITEIAVLKHRLWKCTHLFIKNIRVKASDLQLSVPNAEVACLICDKFSEQDIVAMELLSLVIMHEPIKDHPVLEPLLLCVRRTFGAIYLGTRNGSARDTWRGNDGFAFVASSTPG